MAKLKKLPLIQIYWKIGQGFEPKIDIKEGVSKFLLGGTKSFY